MYKLQGRVKAVLLDLGNTLVHYSPSPERLIHRVILKWGYKVSLDRVLEAQLSAEEAFKPLRDKIRKRVKSEVFRYVELPWEYWIEVNLYMLELLGLPRDISLASTIAEEFRRPENVKLYPDVVPTLRALKGLGYRLGIVSNGPRFAETVIKHTGLDRLVDFYLVSYAVGYEKPHPKIFQLALSRAGVSANEALHVGDSYFHDVIGARAANITPVLLDRDGKCPNMHDSGYIRISNLDELLDMLMSP